MNAKSQPLPAGIMPGDVNIELFADPDNFGKCLFIRYGRTQPFHELHPNIITELYRECFSDKKAVKALKEMGITPENIVEHYNFCNRGALDGEADISESGTMTREYFNCGRRGKCIGEGRVCKFNIHGIDFTPRELECIRLNNEGKNYSEIQSEMGFRKPTAVNSLHARCRMKLGAKDKTEMVIKSQQLGIN